MRSDPTPAPIKPILVAACLLVVAGCHGDQSPGQGGEHEEEHAGHVVPAHKPKTFPEAVRRLRELNDQIGRDVVDRKPGSVLDATPLQIALDIANWLPEIAADSDMPEKPWNEVNTRSVTLVRDIQAILSGSPGDAADVVDDANLEIGNLEQLLVASDPRWFGGSGRIAPATREDRPISEVDHSSKVMPH